MGLTLALTGAVLLDRKSREPMLLLFTAKDISSQVSFSKAWKTAERYAKKAFGPKYTPDEMIQLMDDLGWYFKGQPTLIVED